MAAERLRRPNAGSRMPKLLEEHADEEENKEDDEFYKTTYGGFNEVEEDNDYEVEEIEEDIVDSDFSLSEKEEEDEEGSEDETKKKRQKKKVKTKQTISTSATPKPRKPSVKRVIEAVAPVDKRERMRPSTLSRINKTSNKLTAKRHPKMPEMRRLTQEELLAEARITQEKNLASLAQFLKLEEEKKNSKITKVRYQGPIIKFQSYRVPLIEDTNATNDEITVRYCSRNFLEFTDTHNFPKGYFPASKVKYPEKPICIVTGLPANYKDPLTGLPYATIEAFKYIRQHRKRIKEELARKNPHSKKKKKKEAVGTVIN